MWRFIRTLNGCGHTTERDRQNQYRIIGWSFAWVFCWVLVTWCIKNERLTSLSLVIPAILVTTCLGLGMMVAYRRFLREADELRRKIELDALALAVGVGLVGGVCCRMLEKAGVVTNIPVFEMVVVLICATQSLGIVVGLRRYT